MPPQSLSKSLLLDDSGEGASAARRLWRTEPLRDILTDLPSTIRTPPPRLRRGVHHPYAGVRTGCPYCPTPVSGAVRASTPGRAQRTPQRPAPSCRVRAGVQSGRAERPQWTPQGPAVASGRSRGTPAPRTPPGRCPAWIPRGQRADTPEGTVNTGGHTAAAMASQFTTPWSSSATVPVWTCSNGGADLPAGEGERRQGARSGAGGRAARPATRAVQGSGQVVSPLLAGGSLYTRRGLT